MAHVIDSVFISSKCPKKLEPLTIQINNLKGYFLESNVLESFVKVLKKKIASLKIKNLELRHNAHEHGGQLTVLKVNDLNSMVRISYLTVKGYIDISPNEENINLQQVLQEEKGEMV